MHPENYREFVKHFYVELLERISRVKNKDCSQRRDVGEGLINVRI